MPIKITIESGSEGKIVFRGATREQTEAVLRIMLKIPPAAPELKDLLKKISA